MGAGNVNPFAGEKGVSSSYTSAFAITPADGADLAKYARALYVTTSGTLVVDFIDGGSSISLGTVPLGLLLGGVKRVRATGTTAVVVGLQ